MGTEWIENRYGMGTERIWNGYRMDTKQIQNGNRNTCGMATEHILSSVPCWVSSDGYCIFTLPALQWIKATFFSSSFRNWSTSSQKGLINSNGGALWSSKGNVATKQNGKESSSEYTTQKKTWIRACPWDKHLSNIACPGQILVCSFIDFISRSLTHCHKWEWKGTCSERKSTCFRSLDNSPELLT